MSETKPLPKLDDLDPSLHKYIHWPEGNERACHQCGIALVHPHLCTMCYGDDDTGDWFCLLCDVCCGC